MSVKVTVRDEDIKDAGFGTINCPVARALRREHGFAYVWVCASYIWMGDEQANAKHYKPDLKTTNKIRRYDQSRQMEPFVAELEER